MSKSRTFSNALLKLIFNAVPIMGIADNANGDSLTHLFIALHTADPIEDADQTAHETAYSGYARVGIARTTASWVVDENTVRPSADIDFAVCTAESGAPITHVSIGTAGNGAGRILYTGTLLPKIVMGIGVMPRIPATSAITEA